MSTLDTYGTLLAHALFPAFEMLRGRPTVQLMRQLDRTEHWSTEELCEMQLDYLDRLQPEPLLVPADGQGRGQVLEIAQLIACDIHPLNNLRVLKYLMAEMGLSDAQKNTWYAHWITVGFNALEAMLPDHDGWCVGDAPTVADCCLVPQVANAERMKIDLAAWPRIVRIAAFARLHPAFVQAEPQRQPDYTA